MVETFYWKLYEQCLNSLLYSGAFRISSAFYLWYYCLVFSNECWHSFSCLFYFWSSIFYWQLTNIVIQCYSYCSCFFLCSKEFVLVIYMILGLCLYVPSNIIFSIITKKSRFVIRKSTGAGSAVHPVPSINMYVCHVQC